MSAKIYLNLLFFSVILYQEIFATLSDKDTSLSSNFLLRKRRVINHFPEGRAATRIQAVYYLVRIKEASYIQCAGSIMSHYTVLTSARCVLRDLLMYQVYSGAVGTSGYNIHHVTSKAVHYGNAPHDQFDGIALITVDPPFVYNTKTGPIELHAGLIPANAMVTVFGWGNLYPLQPGSETRKRLRRITLPIMNHAECRAIYAGRYNITDKHICTYHEQQYCARDDTGVPLIFNNELVGVHILKGEYTNQRNPDIFLNVQRPEYREWINEHTLLM